MPAVSLFPEGGQKLHVRTKRLIVSAISTLMSKGVLLLVSVISVPITIRYLGAEYFGVWVTLSTTVSLLLALDLGVANSLTNFISEAYARSDKDYASTYSTTALGIMAILAFGLGSMAWLVWPWLHWDHLFHLSSPTNSIVVSRAAAALLTIFLIGLPASLAAKVLGGYQELRFANIFAAIGGMLSLSTIVVLVRMHAGFVSLLAGGSGALVAANLLSLVWIWFFHKPWLLPRPHHLKASAARRMMDCGWKFLVLQISALIAFNSDNLVVIHYLGPAQVAAYSVTWRLVGNAAVLQTLLIPALWPAFSEAFARGDMQWVGRVFRGTLRITMGSALVFAVVAALGGRWIIRLWATRAAVPSESLLLLMCAWVLISTFMNNTATILLAKGDTTQQAWCSLIAAAVNLALSIYLVQRIGAPGVILGTIISYLLILVVPQTWKTWGVIHQSGTELKRDDLESVINFIPLESKK